MKYTLLMLLGLLISCSKPLNHIVLDEAIKENICDTQTIPINEGDSEQVLIAKNALGNQKLIDCHNAMTGTNRNVESIKDLF